MAATHFANPVFFCGNENRRERVRTTLGGPALQIRGPQILARTAVKVERFYNTIMAGA